MSHYTPEEYAKNRDTLLKNIVTFLKNDERFIAAWFTGSFGRGLEDDLSDFDLRIVVADPYVDALCSCTAGQTTGEAIGERLTIYKHFGDPLVLAEAPSFTMDGEGGCFNQVVYRGTANTIDWVFIPQAVARIPSEECLLLLDKVGLPMRLPLIAESLEERIKQVTPLINNFWLMTNVAIKYLLRDKTFSFYGFLNTTEYYLQEAKRLVAGKPQNFKYEEWTETIATTMEGHIALVRSKCTEMLKVMEEAKAMGAQVPEDPMSVTEVWLSML